MSLNCTTLSYSDHALKAMVSRFIHYSEVEEAISDGEILKFYESDKPYPSYLLLKFVKGRPIHVVVAQTSELKECIVITCYEPDTDVWKQGYKEKK